MTRLLYLSSGLTTFASDGDSIINWEDEPIPPKINRSGRPTTCKRARQPSIAPSSDTESAGSSSSSERNCKRSRHEEAAQHPSPNAGLVSQMSKTMLVDPAPNHHVAQPYGYEPPGAAAHELVSDNNAFTQGGPGWLRALPQNEGPYVRHHSMDVAESSYPGSPYPPGPPSLTTSFASGYGPSNDVHTTTPVSEFPSAFPGKHEYGFPVMPHPTTQNTVYHAYDMPQPCFETVPNTPAFSPMLVGQAGHFHQPEDVAHHVGHQALPFTLVAGQQRYHLNGEGMMEADHHRGMRKRQQHPVGFAVPDHQAMQLHHEYQHRPIDYQQMPINGLPTIHTEVQRPPPNDRPIYNWAEVMPDGNIPAQSLPGTVHRGFTGQ